MIVGSGTGAAREPDSGQQFVFDERLYCSFTRSFRRQPVARGGSQSGQATAADLQEELQRSAEAAATLDFLGRALVLPAFAYDDGPSLAREEAFELWRDAMHREAVASGGLVPVQTKRAPPRFRRRSGVLAAAAARTLTGQLGALTVGTPEARIARLRRAVGFSARVHCSAVDLTARCVMITLTYRDGGDWRPDHVRTFTAHIRKHLARRSVAFRYCWVAELQKRGAVHYHVALWLPADVVLPKPDLCGWWSFGFTRIEVARNAVPYLMKYLSKGTHPSAGHALPRGARSYGCGGLGVEMRLARRWLSLPGFIQARADVSLSEGWRRLAGGGWVDPDGQVWASEYRAVRVGPLFGVIKVLDHGRPLANVGGVFSFISGGPA